MLTIATNEATKGWGKEIWEARTRFVPHQALSPPQGNHVTNVRQDNPMRPRSEGTPPQPDLNPHTLLKPSNHEPRKDPHSPTSCSRSKHAAASSSRSSTLGPGFFQFSLRKFAKLGRSHKPGNSTVSSKERQSRELVQSTRRKPRCGSRAWPPRCPGMPLYT